MSEEKKDTQVELGDVGEIELPTIDVSKYIGTKASIVSVTEHKGMHGYYVRAETGPLDTIGEGDKAFELKASRILGLGVDAEGKIGWGKETKMGLYLKKMGVAHYRDLVGKEVVVQSHTSKSGTEFLTF